MPTVCGHLWTSIFSEFPFESLLIYNSLSALPFLWVFESTTLSCPYLQEARSDRNNKLFADISIDCIVQMMNFMTKSLSKASILLTLEKSGTVSSNLSSINTVSMKSISHSTSHSQHYFEFMVVSIACNHKVNYLAMQYPLFFWHDGFNKRMTFG